MQLPLPEGVRAGGRYASWSPAVPRYVVVDVDGTLIARGTTATPVVAAAVAAAHEAGLRVGFATGRLPTGVRELHGQLQPEGPHIVHNGAQVRVEGRPVRTWPLGFEIAAELRTWCLREGMYGEFFVGEDFWVTDEREEVRRHWEYVTGEPAGLVADLDVARAVVIKATLVPADAAQLARALAAVDALGLTSGAATSPLVPGMTFVNVTAPEADKGQALVFAAGRVGCSLEEVVAVGDGLNDLTMLAVAGTAIAMGQAPREVHDLAHVIVPEVEADGVAHALHATATWCVDGVRGLERRDDAP